MKKCRIDKSIHICIVCGMNGVSLWVRTARLAQLCREKKNYIDAQDTVPNTDHLHAIIIAGPKVGNKKGNNVRWTLNEY